MEDIIQVCNVSFSYNGEGKKVLHDVSFEVKKGEILAVIGENDSGKSTLCQILVGLIPHYITGELEGDVIIEGSKISDMSMGELATKIGLVFQNPFNQLTYTTSTVRDELAFGLGNIGVPREEMILRVEQMAKLMRVTEILDRNPLQLSGGQVQRVALGSCLIMNPDIVVLDECCSQLDPLGSEEIFSIINDLKERGMTIVIVDHDMERVARIADRVMVLHDSEIMKLEETKAVFSDKSLREYAGVPDFTVMGECLEEMNLYHGPVLVREEETVSAVLASRIEDER